jgi:hypothetical protein
MSPNQILLQDLVLTGTASEADVLIGKTFYSTDPQYKQTGIYTPPVLDGTADPCDVRPGKTFYNIDPLTKLTGIMPLEGTTIDLPSSATVRHTGAAALSCSVNVYKSCTDLSSSIYVHHRFEKAKYVNLSTRSNVTAVLSVQIH